MISIRTLTPVCLMAAGTLAASQMPAPAPQPPTPPALLAAQAATPAPPAPPQTPAVATQPPGQNMHPLMPPADTADWTDLAVQIQDKIGKLDLKDLTDQLKDMRFDKLDTLGIDADQIREQAQQAAEQAREAAEQAREQVQVNSEQIREQVREQAEQAREQARQAVEQSRDLMQRDWSGFAKGFAFAAQTPMPPMPPMPPQPKMAAPYVVNIRRGSIDSLYERGLSSLDAHRYDQALDYFTEVATRGNNHADGALYWKAYALNKLGRRDDATAALAELHKAFPSSRWLDDAKALEIEVKQSSGKPVSPEAESNDELKLLALEGLVQSDPDKAFPILEQLLKKTQSPNFKRRAIYVLALNSSPRAQQLLEQIAKGGGNPDMQMTAIQYMGRSSKNPNKSQVLFDIYNSSSDANVKRAVLNALNSNRDQAHLMQIAKADKSPEMRQEAIRMLGGNATASDMWSLYQAETDPDVKRTILDYMSGSTDKLLEVIKTEKDAKLRRSAIQRLSSTRAASTSDALVQAYGSETDPNVKRSIVDALAGQRNGKALVEVARKESDPDLKRSIVRRMLDIKSPEVTSYLEEILK